MTTRSSPVARRPRHRPGSSPRAVLGALLVVAGLGVAACASESSTAGTDEVPVLLTTPVVTTPPTTSVVAPTTSLVTATTADGPASTGAAPGSSADPASTSSTSAAGPTDPGSTATDSSTPTTGTTADATSTSAASTSTSTTLDIEPPPSPPPPTIPVPTAARPPDTVGGGDVDYLLTPTSIVGLQFGASTDTVLERMVELLGDPLSIAELAECAGGPAYGYQWFNAAVIVTDEGLAYYIVGMDLDLYGQAPIPGWHTNSGVTVGADQAALDSAWPGEVAYDPPQGGVVTFTVTGGADMGLSGRLYNGVVQALSAGTTTC